MQAKRNNGSNSTNKRKDDGIGRIQYLVYNPKTDSLYVWTGKMRLNGTEKQYLVETVYQHTFWMHEQWADSFEVIGVL